MIANRVVSRSLYNTHGINAAIKTTKIEYVTIM
jgi:hypothetical protein